MKILFQLLLIYFLFLIQAGIAHYAPDLVMLALVIFALNEPKKAVLTLSCFAGFCLDLVTPQTFGFNLLLLILTGFSISNLRTMVYYANRYALVLLAIALGLKYGLGFLLFRVMPPVLEVLLSSLATLLLMLPFSFFKSKHYEY
ncbi:MAG: rod shape-determining protein MreD [candidate division WOR-3 bacterium]